MTVPSLHHLALRAIIKNISTLESVGDLPYDFCRPFLLKVENPDQLRRIELNSPKIAGEDAELWKAFCKRDVPHYKQYADEPSNPQSWWKFYRYVKRKDQDENAIQEAKLRESMEALEKKKTENKAAITDNLVDPTRRRKPQYPNHLAYNRVRKQVIAVPRKVQLPPHLLAERKAAAQKKLGLPDDQRPSPRSTLQANSSISSSRATASRPLTHRPVEAPKSAADSKSHDPSRSTVPTSRVSFDELFDDLPQERASSSPPIPSPRSSTSPQRALPVGVKVPPPKAPPPSSSTKKRKREVSVFMPPKKR